MAVLIDTSALFALIDDNDRHHREAAAALSMLRADQSRLTTHSYIVCEAVALLDRRAGRPAVAALADLMEVVSVRWVDAELHRRAMTSFLGSASAPISLVDWTSFLVMRDARISRAFAFDRDFAAQGFELIPG